MQSLQLIQSRNARVPRPNRGVCDPVKGISRALEEPKIVDFPSLDVPGSEQAGSRWSRGSGIFFGGLSIEAKREFDWLATHLHYPSATVLIAEDRIPFNTLFLLEGHVDISMNSSDGRRFLLEVAGAGNILGLTSAISGDPSRIRAETRYPCKIASMRRQDFLDFLLRHPDACQNVARELGLHCVRACERLRILGLAVSAPARLACMLLEWCKSGQQTKSGTKIRLMLTHGEIGEFIGASRETVSRALAELKNLVLIKQRGSILIVPSLSALASYAGIDSLPDPNSPAA